MKSSITLNKCRICICQLSATVGSYDMYKLHTLAFKFTTCTDLLVTKQEEQLPSQLCQECYDQLEHLYAFRAKCIAADAHWRLKIATDVADKHSHSLGAAADQELEQAQERFESILSVEDEVKGSPLANEETEIELPETEVTVEDRIEIAQVNGKEPFESSKPSASSFKCNICGLRFLVEHRLLAHKRQHEGLMPYPCNEAGCKRAFNRFHCLSEHLKQHAGASRWFSCEQEGCHKMYRHKPTLMMHMRRCHKLGPELKSHVCEFCGKVFNSSAVLNDHRYTHKDESELPHACQEPDCSRRFSSREKLKVHMMRHAGIKNFSCPYCGMRKTTRNELKIHMNYHTLERTWPCRFCSKVCNSSGNLKMHVRTVHERARDYACSYCDRSFAKADTRKYHEMTHTGEKPHECAECGKCFTQPAALRTHRKIHERQHTDLDTKNPTVYKVLVSAASEPVSASIVQLDGNSK